MGRISVRCIITLVLSVMFLTSTIKLGEFGIKQAKYNTWNASTVNPPTSRGNNSNFSTITTISEKKVRPEVHHIAFLKVHKAASSTVQNILYRFGLRRNLTFVLPKTGHFISKTKTKYRPVLPSRSSTGKYDILCNHAIFNKEYFSGYMYPDAVYVAIVREPFNLLVSAAMYYKYNFGHVYLEKMPVDTFIRDLVVHPELHEASPLSKSRTFNMMTRNFGLMFSSLEEARNMSNEDFSKFVTDIEKSFDFVLVVERFEESLILLKRKFNWCTKDILYITRNARGPDLIKPVQFDTETMTTFKELHRFDFRLYELFSRKLEDRIKQESKLKEETESFKSILLKVSHFCTVIQGETMTIEQSDWNEEFVVTKEDCQLMLLEEITFCRKLRTLYTNGTFSLQTN